MARVDEGQEAIARIRMAVTAYDLRCNSAHRQETATEVTDGDSTSSDVEPELDDGAQADTTLNSDGGSASKLPSTWAFGSPENLISMSRMEETSRGNVAYRDFSKRLLAFLVEHIPGEGEQLSAARNMKVRRTGLKIDSQHAHRTHMM